MNPFISSKFILIMLIFLCLFPEIEAKKIKNTFRIDKERNKTQEKETKIEGTQINLTDTLSCNENLKTLLSQLKVCTYSGFDKEVGSNIESFILTNKSDATIVGFQVKIDYLDIKGRMLHSQIVRETCYVPPGEGRRIDIKSWDKQHTFYYFLGNQPKRVATPFKVNFTPLAFWVQN